MKSTLIEMPPRKTIIAKSSWTKKELADVHLEALLFCEYGCTYCSSNAGLHLRFQKNSINAAVADQTNESFNPHDAAQIVIAYSEFLEALDDQLSRKRRKPGAGKTLVYSQLTDGFSPVLLRTGTCRKVLDLLLEKTEYRIRILTKNAIIGRPEWVDYFAKHSDRFVVGLSIGTLDDEFARRLELRTSRPTSRASALRNLQDAGVPTFGMLCPVFPTVLESDELERLVEAIRPERCEHVWAEPYNERHNWGSVRDSFVEQSPMWQWMTRVFADGFQPIWSDYATSLYRRILRTAIDGGWDDKLNYLLYEDQITPEDAPAFLELRGVLLQSKPKTDGSSRNQSFAEFQLRKSASLNRC